MKKFYLSQAFITELETNRGKQLVYELELIKNDIDALSKSDATFRKLRFTKIRDSVERLRLYVAEPFSFFPDVNLFLLSDGLPVGVCTIRSNDVIWSSRGHMERGCICNHLVYTDVKVLISRAVYICIND